MVGKTILIVDDEAPIREMIAVALEMAGYECLEAENTQQAHAVIVDRKPDLILLDWMLPGTSGIELARRLKRDELTVDIPIIMLTASSDEADRVIGLELGADDYLVKPFSFTELLLRIRTLLRRGVVREAEQVQLADLQLDVLRRKVSRQGQVIALTNKEFALLHLLMRREGEVLSRTLIASEVWDMNFDSDTNVIEVAIRRLRAKVDDDYPQRLIHTVRGIGYVCEERPCPPAAP